jgi:hypothetical protein
MKNNFLEIYSSPQKTSSDSKTLLKNCGFSPNFFYDLEINVLTLKKGDIKKIKSENDIQLLKAQEEKVYQKKIYEAEDKDIFNKQYIELKNNIYLNNYNSSNNNISSYPTIPSQDCLIKNISDVNTKANNKYLINAYKSKHKKKYSKLYEFNSIELAKKNRNKLYHKCCYPGCNRTFSSSGWLKAHLKQHLKHIHNSKYCKLFEKFVLNEQIKKMNKKKDFFLDIKNGNNNLNNALSDFQNNCQNKNNENTKNNTLFFPGITPPKQNGFAIENDMFLNNENNPLFSHNFNNEAYKVNFH